MRALDRKLLRDAFHMRGQLGAIAAIVASAVATFVTMQGNYEGLRVAQNAFYAEYRFSHVFAHIERAPEAIAARLRAIDGVAVVDTRVVADVTLDVPGLNEPATGRLISIPPDQQVMLNRLYLRAGRFPEANDEVVASERFSRANALAPGASVEAVINGRWKRLRVVGIGITPEYVNEISGEATFPDYRRFGVLWMRRAALAPAFSLEGAFNDVTFALAPGASGRNVIAAVDRVLARYGGGGAYGRDDQFSHRFLRDELKQDAATATVIPAIFVAVAAFLIHTVLSRLVAGQREQIAVLKAFGYSNAPIAMHYVKFTILTILAGSAAGIPLGIFMGTKLTALYKDFFAFPSLEFTPTPLATGIAVGVTAATAVGAALASVRRAIDVPPAEGMRGEPPRLYSRTAIEPLHRAFSSAGRMVLRTLERRPVRALLSVIGIALAVMILVAGRYTFDALEGMIAIEFRGAQRDDAAVFFTHPKPASALSDLRRLPGVREAEPMRVAPVRIAHGHHSRRIALTGLDPGGHLRQAVDSAARRHGIPPHGVMVTRKLAKVLGASRGDMVRLELLEGRRNTIELPVVDTVDSLIGLNAWVTLDTMHRFLGERDAISGAYLAVERSSRAALNRELKRMPVIRTAAFREVMLKSFRATIARNLDISMGAIIIFACVIAFGVIYNSARIALSERGRDLASLRVLGFTQREVAAMLFAEQALLTLVAIPLGFLLGRGIADLFVIIFETEEYRLPAGISGETYAFAFIVVVLASFVSAAAVRHRIARLDLVEVLKTRE